MATRGGNQAWRALSETHTRDGEPVEPMSAEAERAYKAAILPQNVVIAPTPIRRWLAEFLPEVAAGTLDLDELLHVVDEDLSLPPAPCAFCGRPYRRSDGAAWRSGICAVCYLGRMRDAHHEKLAVLEAQREVNALKSDIMRCRDDLDPDRPRAHAPYRVCETCGERLPPAKAHPHRTCSECIEREAKHERPKRAAMVRPPDRYGAHKHDTNAAPGARLLECSCGFRRHESASDTDDRCPDCKARDERRRETRQRDGGATMQA